MLALQIRLADPCSRNWRLALSVVTSPTKTRSIASHCSALQPSCRTWASCPSRRPSSFMQPRGKRCRGSFGIQSTHILEAPASTT
eukprot:1107397-Prymnesium_polylepis.1